MFDDFLEALKDDHFNEYPVDVRTFVQGEQYLNQPELSDIQYDIVEAMSQIYKLEDLQNIMGAVEGKRHYDKYTKNELILQLGKGTIGDDSLVWTDDYGYRRPTDLLDSYGTTLVGHRGPFSSSAFFSEGEEDAFRVTTEKGFFITSNMSHGFYGWKSSPHGKSYSMKNDISEYPLASLSPGDILGIKFGYDEPKNPVKISLDEAKFIGYMLGDGTLARVKPNGAFERSTMEFTNATPEVQEDMLGIVERLGGSFEVGVSGKGCWKIYIRGLGDLSKRLGLVQEYNSQKPWNGWWLNVSDINLKAIIGALWDTDGWSHIQSRNGGTSINLALEVTSPDIVVGVHYALQRLGIVSKAYLSRGARGNGKHSPTYRVQISSFRDALRFARIIDTHKDLSEIAINANMLGIVERDKSFIYGDRIKSIEYVGKKELYTTIVEVDHSYTANGMIHANSGKDFVSTVACAYVVYKLLCLKDPARYYGKPSGDAIDIINIAINAQQAKNVFFKGFKTKIEKSQWFAGKYYAKMDSIEFDHSITVYSGHSERESHEGLNLLMAVLDEISGFATEVGTGNDQGKTADNIYKAFRASVDSRFPDLGKVALLSFPRFPGDFISQRYDSVILEKETITKTHKFIMNDELPEEMEGNSLEITWDEDTIVSYKYPGIYAIKRPTWVVNPTRKIDDFKLAFYTDLGDAMMRFACVPTYSSDAFFKQAEKVRAAMTVQNPLDSNRRFIENFKPDPDKVYYVHADLAQLHDKCAVAIAHVEKWVNIQVIKDYEQVAPIVVVDAVAWWEPKVEGPVNLSEVKQWIQNLRRLGFNIGMVSFDRWQSFDIQNELKQVGIRTETVSVAKKHYEDMAMLIYEDRLAMPAIDLLFEELTELKIVKQTRVDHPRKKSKDLADAVCGAIFGAIAHTPKDLFGEVEIHTFRDRPKDPIGLAKDNVIQLTPKEMPEDIKDYLNSFGYL